jgi:hypothetical protein
MQKAFLYAASLAFAIGVLLVACAAQAQGVSQNATAGAYSVALKVLPAESFAGPGADMAWDGGARANMLNGAKKPNHHLVVFVQKDGKPVEKANVSIRYRMLSPKKTGWKSLPVARMHVAGKGPETTHYGNNVMLPAGSYEARVKVNGSPAAVFNFTLSQ